MLITWGWTQSVKLDFFLFELAKTRKIQIKLSHQVENGTDAKIAYLRSQKIIV